MTVELRIDETSLETFCRKLINRSRDIAKTQDSLATLESFIAVFGKSQQGTADYRSIESKIRSFVEQCRQQLLVQRTEELSKALAQRDLSWVTAIHDPLSRDGFHQIMQTIIERLGEEELSLIANWARGWSRDARKKAERASGYPDALNFVKAGVDVREYQAMLDVGQCLQHYE